MLSAIEAPKQTSWGFIVCSFLPCVRCRMINFCCFMKIYVAKNAKAPPNTKVNKESAVLANEGVAIARCYVIGLMAT